MSDIIEQYNKAEEQFFDVATKLFVLIGSYTEHEYGYGGWTGNSETIEEEICLFTSREKAEAYVKKSRLKNPTSDRKFKSNSGLSLYDYVEICEYQPNILYVKE